ncbi:MAG TPA: glycosyltransferase family 2 protein [Planktothrix sp.]|jgi:glycosyltransferase involved in cell wall biosynthesis
MYDVSIILPTHNRAHLLARSIDSVLAQDFQSFELVVVDDCSTDGTADVVKAIKDSRVRYLPLVQQHGAAGARNQGIAATTAPLLAFQDSDDEWISGKLAAQLEVMKSYPGVGVVYSDMQRYLQNGDIKDFPAPDVESDAIVNPLTMRYCVESIGIQSCLIRRNLLEKVSLADGPFDIQLNALEDLELFIRLSRVCQFRRINKPLVRYHETDGISSDLSRLARAHEMLLCKYQRELTTNKRFLAIQTMSIAWLFKAGREQSVAKPNLSVD